VSIHGLAPRSLSSAAASQIASKVTGGHSWIRRWPAARAQRGNTAAESAAVCCGLGLRVEPNRGNGSAVAAKQPSRFARARRRRLRIEASELQRRMTRTRVNCCKLLESRQLRRPSGSGESWLEPRRDTSKARCYFGNVEPSTFLPTCRSFGVVSELPPFVRLR
jgi:hypothetical protein